MKKIHIVDEIYAMVDDEDYDRLVKYRWGFSDGYAVRDHKRIAMHREIMQCPKGLVVDHIDGNRMNNQKYNLRIMTQSENMRLGMQNYRKILKEMKKCE